MNEVKSERLKRSLQRLNREDINRIHLKYLTDNEKQLFGTIPRITSRADNHELFITALSKQKGICFLCEHAIAELCENAVILELRVYTEKKYPSNDDIKAVICEKCFEVGVISSALNYDNLFSYLAARYRYEGEGQKSLADRIGVNQATVSRIKNKKVDSVSLKVTKLTHQLFAEKYREHKKDLEDLHEKFIQELIKYGYPIENIKRKHMILPHHSKNRNHMLTCDIGITNNKNEVIAICFQESPAPKKENEIVHYIDLLKSFRAKFLFIFSKDESSFFRYKNLQGDDVKLKNCLKRIDSIPKYNPNHNSQADSISSDNREKYRMPRRQ